MAEIKPNQAVLLSDAEHAEMISGNGPSLSQLGSADTHCALCDHRDPRHPPENWGGMLKEPRFNWICSTCSIDLLNAVDMWRTRAENVLAMSTPNLDAPVPRKGESDSEELFSSFSASPEDPQTGATPSDQDAIEAISPTPKPGRFRRMVDYFYPRHSPRMDTP